MASTDGQGTIPKVSLCGINQHLPQRYEKLISGMYLGEIVRHALIDLASRKILFQGQQPSALKNQNLFPTKLLTAIET